MNMNHVLFFTACDTNYFALCMDLIMSLKWARGEMPRMRILDVGLHPQQSAELRKHVEAVIEPGWELGQHEIYPPWFRAMTSRPFLPKYASDAEIIVWMDSDTWVQSWPPLEKLIHAASGGKLAIVEEKVGGIGFSVLINTSINFIMDSYNADSLKTNGRRCYEQCFGSEIADAYSDLSVFNSGVFALRADSPTWAIWRDVVATGLRGGFHMLVEQQALTIAIHQGRVPVALQAQEANFVCVHGLPWFDPARRKFTLPNKKDVLLGVVHLTDAKKYQRLPIPVFPNGQVSMMSLLFRDQFRRNEYCPCGSGKRYKHCHGRLT